MRSGIETAKERATPMSMCDVRRKHRMRGWGKRSAVPLHGDRLIAFAPSVLRSWLVK